jgi:hypothetical protein
MERPVNKDIRELRKFLLRHRRREGLSYRELTLDINLTVRRVAFPWYTTTSSAVHLFCSGKTKTVRRLTREALKAYRKEKEKSRG